ncbi:MAG: tetratricopeptide repeat protein [Bacteroidales bacterium]|jgi:tetratricopeptide (TPR) repeat protein|nr:tetratricopeptide repeat protein [Bacteroidales bacterium]
MKGQGFFWNRNLIIVLVVSFILMGFSTETFSQSDRKRIREGNRDYRDGKYGEAELAYRRATDIQRSTSDAWFNLGNAIYRQEKYGDAVSTYEKNASQNDNPVKKSNSFYNMGNSLLSSQKIEESIEAYKRSLRLNPGNLEAKYNLAYAQDLLSKQQQEKENQQDQGKDQEQQENPQNEDKNKEQDKNDQQQEKNDTGDNTPDEQQQQQQKERQSGISGEDARRLLEALVANEQNIQEKVQKEKAVASMVRTLKNW